MAPKANPELREAWRNRIERQRQSGLTVSAFCAEEGLSQANFYLWKRKLQSPGSPRRRRRSAARTALSPSRPGQTSSTGGAPATFVQVPLPQALSSPWIEVALAEGTVIRIPQQNLAAVQTVLRTLGGAGVPGREERPYA